MKPLIVVPYRNRQEHLDIFIPKVKAYLDCDIAVIEQWDSKPFNRGKLLNIGFLENPTGYDHYIFHDVDMIPISVKYFAMPGVYQLAKSDIQKVDYMGGVTLFSKDYFVKSEGYSNNFFSRAEDNEMCFNLKKKGIRVRFNAGLFASLTHERTGPEFDPVLWKKAQQPRVNDGLAHCTYKIISKENKELYQHIIVEL